MTPNKDDVILGILLVIGASMVTIGLGLIIDWAIQ